MGIWQKARLKPSTAIPRLTSNPMSTVQRIARNTTLLLLSNVASFVLGFFITMYVARYLGAQGFDGPDW